MTVLREPRGSTSRRSNPGRARRRQILVRRCSLLLLVMIFGFFFAFIAVGLFRGSPSSQTNGIYQGSNQSELPDDPPKVPVYEAFGEEVTPAGKSLSAKIAQTALTYSRGESVRPVATRVGRFGSRVSPSVLRPAFVPGSRSWAKTIYPQMAGYTGDTMGAMVVVRQTTEDEQGRRTNQTRVVDVRLKLVGGEWELDRLGSVGGSPVKRPVDLSPEAKAVLDDPAIDLPDSSRWDIYRGEVSDDLLAALSSAAGSFRFRVAVLKTGHPPSVWGTSNPSAHSEGAAADIWSVAGKPVVLQRESGSAAFDLASAWVSGGAVQVGSPWTFTSDGFSTFTDEVHQDHIHVQP